MLLGLEQRIDQNMESSLGTPYYIPNFATFRNNLLAVGNSCEVSCSVDLLR